MSLNLFRKPAQLIKSSNNKKAALIFMLALNGYYTDHKKSYQEYLKEKNF
jgi:hypothetical protein